MKIRVFTKQCDIVLQPTSTQKHYIFNVLRQRPGNIVYLFDGYNEYEYKIQPDYTLVQIQLIRKIIKNQNLYLAIACIKPKNLELAVAKATELGVSEIFVLQTQFTQIYHINIVRLRKIIIESCEQSNRISIPVIHDMCRLTTFLNTITNCNWGVCNPKATQYIYDSHINGVIVGPEGGWSSAELQLLEKISQIKLSDNILRSETAAITAVGQLAIQKHYTVSLT